MIRNLVVSVVAGLLVAYALQAQAIIIQRTDHGYVMLVDTPTGRHCLGMPQHLNLEYIPQDPTDLEAAAAKSDWPKPTPQQRAACERMKKIVWKVYSNQDQSTQPVYKVDDNGHHVRNKVTDEKIDEIDTNATCGDYINKYGISTDLTYREVTGKAGKQGAALCKKYN